MYYVEWNKTKEEWESEIETQDGQILHAWHKAQLIKFKNTLNSKDVEAIEHHRNRSYGRDPYSES